VWGVEVGSLRVFGGEDGGGGGLCGGIGAFCKSVSLSNSLSETDFRFPSPWVRFQTEIFVEELAFDLEFEDVRCVTWLFKKFISTILCRELTTELESCNMMMSVHDVYPLQQQRWGEKKCRPH